jgi:hypothetical protein
MAEYLTNIKNTPPGQNKYIPGGDLLHRDDEGAPPQIGVENMDGDDSDDGESEWLKRSREAYYSSTSYVDSNYRKAWEDSIRAFNNMHSLDSKYLNPAYAKRSNIFKPKVRGAIRKSESAASAAFFSNMDLISTEATNMADVKQRVSAEVMKQLLQYRLTKSIPWFQTVIGGYQDSQVQGVVAAHVYWDYEEGKKDKPCVDLIPAENIRIDPGASWIDPVGTSPYVIHMIPMYVGDVKEMMTKVDPKTGSPKWYTLSTGTLRMAIQEKADSTRLARNKDREDPLDPDSRTVGDYEVIWVQRHIHRKDGEDWLWYTLSDVAMLSDPVPLKEAFFHGERPYVIGCCILETHKIFPSSVPQLAKGLTEETNAIANSRLDNIYLVLNKKWFVRRGKNVDIPSLVRNVPGGVTLMDNVGPEGDVQEVNWPDVTQSSAEEQNRLNADFADLMGDFSPAQSRLARNSKEPAKIMQAEAVAANPLVEYQLKTYVVTFVEPVLRQLAKLEQHYETDKVVLTLAGKKAKVFERYGVSEVTDEILNQDLTINVNIGMGATDPAQKVQRFIQATMAIGEIASNPGFMQAGGNLSEVVKEIYGLTGYQDGMRFMSSEDPEKDMLKKKLQHAGQIIQELGRRCEDKQAEIASKEKIAHEANNTQLILADKQSGKEPLLEHHAKLREQDLKHSEKEKELALKEKLEREKMAREHAHKEKTLQAETSLKTKAQETENEFKHKQLAVSTYHKNQEIEGKQSESEGKMGLAEKAQKDKTKLEREKIQIIVDKRGDTMESTGLEELAEGQKEVAESIKELAEALTKKEDKQKPKVREITVTGPTGKYVGKVTIG